MKAIYYDITLPKYLPAPRWVVVYNQSSNNHDNYKTLLHTFVYPKISQVPEEEKNNHY